MLTASLERTRLLHERIAALERENEELRKIVSDPTEQRFYQTLFESMPGNIAILDRSGVIVAVNAAWRRYYDEHSARPPADYSVGINYLSLCEQACIEDGDGFAKQAGEGIRAVLAGDLTEFQSEYPCGKENQERWFQINVLKVPSPYLGAIVAHLDISKLKKVELEYATVSELLERTGSMAKVGGWSLELATSELTWTRQTYRIHELDTFKIPELQTALEFYPPAARAVLQESIDALVKEGRAYDLELPLITALGRRIWIRTQGLAVWDEGKITRIIGSIQDVTTDKAAEEAIEARERELRMIADVIPATISRIGRDMRYQFVNAYYEKTFGKTRAEIIGKTIEEVHGPEYFLEVEPSVRRTLQGENVTCQCRRKSASGEMREWLATCLPDVDPSGDAVGLFTIAMDITEKKKAEAAQDELFNRLQKIASRVPGVVYQYRLHPDGTSHFPYASDGANEMFGIAPEQLQENTHLLLQRHHPDDHDSLMSSISKSARELSPWNQEFRLRFEDGTVRWYQGNSVPEREDDGSTLWHGFITDITKRKEAEAALRISHAALQAISQGVLITDQRGMIVESNHAFSSITGFSKDDIKNGHCSLVMGERFDSDCRAAIYRAKEQGVEFSREILDYRKDGSHYWNDLTITPVRDASDCITHFVGVSRDITSKKIAEEQRLQLESQLNQARKLESIGRLAGGVAHDFNNMLGVILGYTDLALAKANETPWIQEDLIQIQQAAIRSADLTRQLLAFARKQTVAPKVIELNSVVADMLKLLPRLLGEDVSVCWSPMAAPSAVQIDPSQLEQILTNLCVNARQAIQNIGVIGIKTENRSIGAAQCEGVSDAAPGEYVCLSVSDDGCGMDKETLAKIFEPFFTTKEGGIGTGLGLATVYGAVRQNNGFVTVESEPDCGSTFHIFLPLYQGKMDVQSSTLPASPSTGSETILLVEDEPALLQLTSALLGKRGYNVLAAATPIKALALAADHPQKIDLLLTDVIMPEMNGRNLASLLKARMPNLICVFMSGYPDDVIANRGALEDGTHFLPKPFSLAQLTSTISVALEQARANN